MSATVNEHPTVKAFRAKPVTPVVSAPLDAAWLRKLCLEAGADDVGFVEAGRVRSGTNGTVSSGHFLVPGA